jgi:hypothetical protein
MEILLILTPTALGLSFLFGADSGSDGDNSTEADALLAAESAQT